MSKEKKILKLQVVMTEKQLEETNKIINMARAHYMRDGSSFKKGEIVHKIFKEYAAVKNFIKDVTDEVEYIEMHSSNENITWIMSLINRYLKTPNPGTGRELWGILDQISPKHKCKDVGCIIKEIRRILGI